ncbi:putative membrane protein [Methylomarinovum caldicuralii]|uniref:Membrane protein n=1 Tax=Methylomarinovum caldicuralii TaxID=438856 RepID=A0AAU9C140_9GAMM|nr:putative membrane protein [Methylomarinovum caldicuralii]
MPIPLTYAKKPPLPGLVLLLSPLPAWSHGGLEDDLWRAWTFTPEILAPLLLTGLVYARGCWRRHRQHRPVPVGQIAAFCLGILCFFIALQSPIEPLSDHFLFIHQIEHLLLRVFAPLLMILAMPLAPLIQGLPRRARHSLLAPLVRSRLARGLYGFFSHPLVAPVLFVATLVVWQIPTLHDRAVQDLLLHDLMHLSMIVTGFFFWWLIADPRGTRARLPYGLRLIVLWAVTIPNTLLGAGITLSRQPLYQVYDVLTGRWGIDRLMDQQIGGILIWGPGAMMGVIGTGVVFLVWIRAERKRPAGPHLSAVT